MNELIKCVCFLEKMLKLFIILITLITLKSNQEEDECCFNTKKALKFGVQVVLTNFNELKELKFKCKLPQNYSILSFQPNKPIILDNSLEINDLSIIQSNELLVIVFYNFKGFDFTSNPFKNLKSNVNDYNKLIQLKSPFDLYLNNKLIDASNCNEENLKNANFIQQFPGAVFEILRANKNSGETCPFIFKNSILSLLTINNLRESLVFTNRFTFLNVTITESLDSLIWQTYLFMYHSDLNSKLLNKHVFKQLACLDINGIINQIEFETFKNLDNLRLLRIKSQNIKQLFVKNNKWLQYLNKNKKQKHFILLIYQSTENVTYYSYPNEDLCLFKDFPHENNVLPILQPNSKSTCTCTELFLIQFTYDADIRFLRDFSTYYIFEDYKEILFNSLIFPDCIHGYPKEDLIKKCNFKKRFENHINFLS